MPANTETQFRLRNLRGRDKRNIYHHSNDPAFEHLNLPHLPHSPKRRAGNSRRPNCPYQIANLPKRTLNKFLNLKLCKKAVDQDFNMEDDEVTIKKSKIKSRFAKRNF